MGNVPVSGGAGGGDGSGSGGGGGGASGREVALSGTVAVGGSDRGAEDGSSNLHPINNDNIVEDVVNQINADAADSLT